MSLPSSQDDHSKKSACRNLEWSPSPRCCPALFTAPATPDSNLVLKALQVVAFAIQRKILPLEAVKRQHDRDLSRGEGRAVLPFALDRKYPNASTDWAWQFVFPAARICRDPQWGSPSRFHLHESVVQKEVAHAVRRAGLTKRVGPHVMRSVSA